MTMHNAQIYSIYWYDCYDDHGDVDVNDAECDNAHVMTMGNHHYKDLSQKQAALDFPCLGYANA